MVAQSSDKPRRKNKRTRSIDRVKRARPIGLGGLLAKPQITHDKRDLRAYARESAEGDLGWDSITYGMMKASCAFFALEVLTGPSEPPYNGKFLIGPHHYEWNRLLLKHDRLCILAPRDHGKTFFFNLAYPLWKATTVRGGKGYIFSATQEQAIRILGDVKDELIRNPRLRHLVPPRGSGNKWAATQIQLTNGHTIYARGFGTKVRGGHPDWLVIDDGINDESIYSETVRKKESEYFFSALSNMVVPSGQIIVVGCVTRDTWVATSNGLRRIGGLNPGEDTPKTFYPLDLAVVGKEGTNNAEKFWVNGVCKTKRVTLEGGYRLEGSCIHPLWVMGEDGVPDWKKSEDVREGDFVAIHGGMNSWGDDIPITLPPVSRKRNEFRFSEKVTKDLAYLIGLWVAEGSYEPTGRVMISNTEPEILSWLGEHPFGMRFEPHQDGHTVRCSAKTFLDLLRSLGCELATAEGKQVPTSIMGGPRKIAREFLRGLFDGDGNVYVKGSVQQVMLGTVSERLARDVQLLLLNFGIFAALSKRPPALPTKRAPNGGRYPLWVLRMTGQEAHSYMDQVGFRLTRKQNEIQNMNCDAGCSFRGIPNQSALISKARSEKPRRKRSATLNPPKINISEVSKAKRPSRKTLKSVVDWFEKYGSCGEGVGGIRSNLEADSLIWLEVKRIDDGEAFTVDFVLDGDHSFVTNGIISHNTPFHMADLYAELAENKRYYFARFQALVGKEETPLWPSRYNKKQLEAKREEIGVIRFTREFQCEPIGDSMSLFPLYLFQGSRVECLTLTLGMAKAYWEALDVTIYMGVDFAMSASVKADFTVIWVMGLDKLGNRWIIDIHRHKGMAYQEQLSLINTVGKKYDPALVFLEANQMQRIFGDELIRTTDLPIHKYVTGAEKNTLDKGVPSLRVLLENGKFKIPRGDAHSVELTDIWINEMRAFTWVDGGMESVGTHDDTVMGCWICDQAIRAGGFTFDFGGDLEDSSEDIDAVLAEMHADPEVPDDEESNDSYVGNPEDGLESDLGEPDILELDGFEVGGIPMVGGSLGY